MSKILRLPIKKHWFEMIAKGIKKEEYRQIKPFYVSRLISFNDGMVDFEVQDFCSEILKKDNFSHENIFDLLDFWGAKFREYDYVELSNGYGKSVPKLLFDFTGIEIKRGNKEWGADDGFCFSVKIGKAVFLAECPSCKHQEKVDGCAYGVEDCRSCGVRYLWDGNNTDTRITTMLESRNAVAT